MIGALELIERHPNEARVEVLRHGRTLDDLGTKRLPWMDAVAIFSTTSPGHPLYDAMFPDSAQWDHHAMLLAAILDSLNIQIWQGGKRRRADFPRPIPRPGVEDKHERKFGGKPVEIEDMQAFLERKRAGATPAAE